MSWILAHLDVILGVVGGLLTVAGIVAKLTSNVIDDFIVGLLKKVVDFVNGIRKPAEPDKTLGDKIAEEHPEIKEPAANTPSAALKATVDRKIADKLFDDIE